MSPLLVRVTEKSLFLLLSMASYVCCHSIWVVLALDPVCSSIDCVEESVVDVTTDHEETNDREGQTKRKKKNGDA